jgi:hypothetical protein
MNVDLVPSDSRNFSVAKTGTIPCPKSHGADQFMALGIVDGKMDAPLPDEVQGDGRTERPIDLSCAIEAFLCANEVKIGVIGDAQNSTSIDQNGTAFNLYIPDGATTI